MSVFSNYFKTIFTVIFLWSLSNIYATDYFQRQTGNWNNPNTWTTNGGWAGTENTGTYPQAGDNVYIRNNGNSATITLTSDAECANLIFENSATSTTIVQGNYNLTLNSWSVDYFNSTTISQTTGYLQINSAITTFRTDKTIANFRVGSGFSFTQTNSTVLNITSNYDYNCFQSVVPTGINAGGATKTNATPCAPTLSATALPDFGNVCTGSTTNPNSFILSGLALNSDNITLATLSGYSYSTSAEGTYSNTLTINQSGGNFAQTIYVKFTPSANTTYNGNIVVSGGGASNLNIAVTGVGANAVMPTVNTPSSANILSTSAKLGGTVTVSGCAESVTERGIYYSTTDGFANGTGTKVSETGTFSTGTFTVNVSGLTPNTTYYFKAFATNANGTAYSSQATFNNTPVTYYSRQSGNWTSPSTWTTAGCGNTVNSGTFPQAGDNVIICQQHNITVNTSGLSCNNLNMTAYATQLTMNNDFTINNNLDLTWQSYISAGTHNLTINGNFTNTPNQYNSRIDYSTGNITIGGNINVSKEGYEPFNCSGSGWVILTNSSSTFTSNSDITIPNFTQPTNGFTKAGTGTITISGSFNQNWGVDAPAGVIVSSSENITNVPSKIYRSIGNGNWSDLSTWEQSYNNGANWIAATSLPAISSEEINIQNGHTVTLNSNLSAETINISSGAGIIVNPRIQLTINGDLVNNGILQLSSDASGTATLLTSGSISGSGTYKTQQYLNSGRNWYMSSPIANASAPSGYTYYKYNEPGNNSGFVAPATAYWEAVNPGTTLTPLIGYIVLPLIGATTVEFTGTTLNNGTQSISLSRTTGKLKEGFNLVGNPYPSYLNWSAATRTDIEPTIWYRTKNNAGNYVYDTFNGIGTNNNQNGAVTGFVHPMQSFWVRVSANKTSGSVTFTNAMRAHESGTNRLKMRSNTQNNEKILRLEVSNGVNSDETVIRFNDDALNTYDQYDAQKMSNSSNTIPEIYTTADNTELAINGMSQPNQETEITLGFRTGESNNFTIKASELINFDDNTVLILKDNYLKSETCLTPFSKYSFSSSAINTTNRFSILFRNNSLTTNNSNPEIIKTAYIYKNTNNQAIIQLNEEVAKDASVEFFNHMGQMQLHINLQSQKTVLNQSLSTGLYVAVVKNNGKSTNLKVMID